MILLDISSFILCDSISAVTVLWKYLLMKLHIFATCDGIYIFAGFRNNGLVYFKICCEKTMLLVEFGEFRICLKNLHPLSFFYFYDISNHFQSY